ncbi:hypothetical protein MtrunA17_Chr4g0031281 [Medicago truncatula]|uniref:Uncharacterized protein n=1 Tax=Medicago truncatula TaxID=3880 RepID=A0A396I885_MEDTR|nr:hypothetical protein MtrunA17_Chr4g0031281 [Medicago truncatula]
MYFAVRQRPYGTFARLPTHNLIRVALRSPSINRRWTKSGR